MQEASKKEFYYYCFFHVLSLRHTNYHHVIMKMTPEEMDDIKQLDAENYTYCLMSSQPLFLEESDLAEMVIRGLVMDGESLLKRFRAQQKKSIRP